MEECCDNCADGYGSDYPCPGVCPCHDLHPEENGMSRINSTESDTYDLITLLHEALTMVQDLIKGYPVDELHRHPEDLEEAIIRTIAAVEGKTEEQVRADRA